MRHVARAEVLVVGAVGILDHDVAGGVVGVAPAADAAKSLKKTLSSTTTPSTELMSMCSSAAALVVEQVATHA
jgi:hypothetical protein